MLLQSTLAIFILVQLSSSVSVLESGCKGPGVFPHPHDCTQFLICAEDHGNVFVAETVPCPEDYSFSESEKTCVRSEKCRPVSPQTGGRSRRATEQGACKSSGPYCEGCDRLVVCANLGERGLTAIANITCSEIDSEMSCSKSSCTTKPETTQPCEGSDKAGAFRCLQPGFFPDPTDCKLFHFCGSDLSHLQGECDVKFDAELGTCPSAESDSNTAQTGNTLCTNSRNTCTDTNGAPIKLPDYPSYYAICIPLATKSRKSPYVYQVSVAKCPDRQEFNDLTLACEFTCTGRRGRFQDPDNCRSYIQCSGSEAVRKSCPENLAFDPKRKICLPEVMVQGCQRTRAIVESTTPNPAATATATTTTTSASTTTRTIPSKGFQCQAPGIFPDESDCQRYITCSLVSRRDGVYFRMRRKQCPFLTYFSSNGFCQFGFCWN